MIAKVRNYKYVCDCFDSFEGEYLKKEHTPKTVNIFFDENMYIENPSDFEKELLGWIVPRYRHSVIMQDTMQKIEFEINNLLHRYRNMKLLFLESDLFFKQKEGMIILHAEKYFDEY